MQSLLQVVDLIGLGEQSQKQKRKREEIDSLEDDDLNQAKRVKTTTSWNHSVEENADYTNVVWNDEPFLLYDQLKKVSECANPHDYVREYRNVMGRHAFITLCSGILPELLRQNEDDEELEIELVKDEINLYYNDFAIYLRKRKRAAARAREANPNIDMKLSVADIREINKTVVGVATFREMRRNLRLKRASEKKKKKGGANEQADNVQPTSGMKLNTDYSNCSYEKIKYLLPPHLNSVIGRSIETKDVKQYEIDMGAKAYLPVSRLHIEKLITENPQHKEYLLDRNTFQEGGEEDDRIVKLYTNAFCKWVLSRQARQQMEEEAKMQKEKNASLLDYTNCTWRGERYLLHPHFKKVTGTKSRPDLVAKFEEQTGEVACISISIGLRDEIVKENPEHSEYLKFPSSFSKANRGVKTDERYLKLFTNNYCHWALKYKHRVA